MSHISRKISLTREAAKARARVLQKEARLAGRPLAYTQALAEVARAAGYANIHELTAQFAAAGPARRQSAGQTPDAHRGQNIGSWFSAFDFNSLADCGGIAVIKSLPGMGLISFIDEISDGRIFELRIDMLDPELRSGMPKIAEDNSVQWPDPLRLIPEGTRFLILSGFNPGLDPVMLESLREHLAQRTLPGAAPSPDMAIIVPCYNDEDANFANRFFADVKAGRELRSNAAENGERPASVPLFGGIKAIHLRDREEMLNSLREWGGLHPDVLAYVMEAPEKRLMYPPSTAPEASQATPRELDVLSQLLTLLAPAPYDSNAYRMAAFSSAVRNAVIDEFLSWLTERKG